MLLKKKKATQENPEMFVTPYGSMPIINSTLYKKLSAKHNISELQIKEFIHFVSDYVCNVIEQGNIEPVRIPQIGSFTPKKKKINFLANFFTGTNRWTNSSPQKK